MFLTRFQLIIVTGILIFTAVSSWLIGLKMRREVKKSLGRKATEQDLADIDTWVEVREAEEKANSESPPK